MPFTLTVDDRFNITEFIKHYCNVISAMNVDDIARIWDRGETELYYIAEEIADPMVGWDAIAGYWTTNKKFISRLTMRTGDLRMHAIAKDLAIIMFPMHWNAALIDQQPPLGGDVNVTAVLRHTPEGWKFIHYAESALGAFPFLRRVYERAVDPQFFLQK